MLKILKYFFIISVFFSSCDLFAQTNTKKVEILHADDLLFDEKLGNGAKRLIGKVQFKHGDALLFCDSAYFYSNNSLDAFGNVHIQQGDSVNIYGDFLNYSGNTRMSEIRRNVRLIQKSSTLQTELLYYNMATTLATYPSGGTIVSKQNVLTSRVGYYNPRKKLFSFKDSVVLTNPQYVMRCDTLNYNSGNNTAYFSGPTHITSSGDKIYCESGWYNTTNDIAKFSKNAYVDTKQQKMKGDSIFFDKVKDEGRAYGNVSIIDSAQSIIVSGNKAVRIGKLETSTVTGNALLKQFYGEDTLFLHADTLRAVDEHPISRKGVKDTSITWRVLYAYKKVKFYRTDMQGKCDSLVYSGKDSIMRLFKDPVMWQEENQLTAEKVEMKITSGQIKNLYLQNQAFIISEEDSIKYNQIKGKQMTGYFNENKLVRIFVEGNGQTIYFAKDKDKLIGINRANCTNLMIYIKDNSVEKITFLKKPDATLFPMSDFIPKEFLLKDFNWRQKERPLSVADIFLK